MKVIRTPDDRFENLPGFPFQPHFLEVAALPDDPAAPRLRVHYIDEGPRDGQVVLCLHGEPSWSYLYRKMVPVLAQAGLRVVCPDFIGFGRSDKLADRSDYTYARLVNWMAQWLQAADLRDITLVAQDWGGLVGLRLLAEHGERFARAVVANTGLPTGDQQMPEAFLEWRRFSQEAPEFPVSAIIDGGTTTPLSAEIKRAYDAPFPDESFKEAARQLPALVPTSPDDPAAEDNRRAWQVLGAWNKPVLTAFSDQDPVTRGGERVFHKLVPGAAGQPHTTIEGAGHFLQEDRGPELGKVVADFIAATPVANEAP